MQDACDRPMRHGVAGAWIRIRNSRRILQNPVYWLTFCGAFLVAIILVGAATMALTFRERALDNTKRELENSVLLLSRHYDQKLDDFAVFQTDTVKYLESVGSISHQFFNGQTSTLEMHEVLRGKVSSYADMAGINIFDSDGFLINSSDVWPVPNTNVADHGYFKRLKAGAITAPFLVELVRSQFDDGWSIVVSQRISGKEGEFLGIVSRSVSPAKIEKFFSSVMLSAGAAISMHHEDGTLLARYPHIDEMMGQNFSNGPVHRSVLAKSNFGTIRLQSPIDGKDRLASARRLTNFPVSIIVTKTVESALADWREQTRILVLAACLSAIVTAVILFLIVRQLVRQHRSSEQRLAREKNRLDTAVNNMSQGLLLFDSSERIVVCNRRYIEMYKLSPDIVKQGCTLLDLLSHRKEVGLLTEDVDQYRRKVLEHVAQDKSAILNTSDGRAIQVLNHRVSGGGWVTTHEDITEQQKLEIERDRNHAFLHQIIDHIPTQITVKDANDARYVLANRVAEIQFGMSRAEIVGKTANELFTPEAAAQIALDDLNAIKSPDGLFLDEGPWASQALGDRYITSRRIGIRDQNGETRFLINVVDDVTDRKLARDKIVHMAHYDALTDLPNRTLLREQLSMRLKSVSASEKLALLYIDIDEFKGINDSLGHPVGDELLKMVAARLKGCVKEGDFVSRLGGDEFAIVQTGIASIEDVSMLVEQIQAAIREPFACLGHQLTTDASIGVALAPEHGSDLDELIKNADLAMYGAKENGRRTYRFFEASMDERIKARRSLEQDMRKAIAEHAFELHYQPLVNLETNEVVGCEALLRWRHPVRGVVSPAEFIPIAEETGLISELGEWVLKTACSEAATWPDNIKIAVNVSPVQFRGNTIALKVAAAIASSGIAPNRLELEITEAVLIHDDEATLAMLHQLRGLGVRIALDDFGTGYSSLSYLQRFPFDKIKIDRSFVKDIATPDGSTSIIQAIVKIAAGRNITTTAEGVETDHQRELLRKLGCTEMQGFLFSPAKAVTDIRRLLRLSDASNRTIA